MFSLLRTCTIRLSIRPSNCTYQNFATQPKIKGWLTKYAKKKAVLKRKGEFGRRREILEKYKDVVPLIECKNPELNHYKDITYGKFLPFPLASSGWLHRRSAGDYFTIYDAVPSEEELKNLNQKLQEVPNLLRMEDFGWKNEMKDNEALISFSDMGLNPDLLKALEAMKIKEPSEIQKQGIPEILKGMNVTLTAETGCGKTLAFLLPLVHNILYYKSMNLRPKEAVDSPFAIIISPSRELASQTYLVAKYLSKFVNIIPKLIIGGDTKTSIKEHDFSEVDIYVGSLGGISKFISKGIILTEYLRTVVLDEADTLLDENFSSKLVHLLKRRIMVRPRSSLDDPGVQLIMVSATMPETLPEKLNTVIPLDTLVEICTEEYSRVLPKVKQKFIRVNHAMRASLLLDLVKSDVKKGDSVIIFRRRKDILRVGQMSEWSIKEEERPLMNAVKGNGIMHNPAMLVLPDNITLPRSIEYSLIPQAATNGDASTSSQSPTWSQHPDNHDDGLSSRGKGFHGSSSSSSSYLQSSQPTEPSARTQEEHPSSPHDTYQSDNDNSHEYKPFNLCEVQENSQDVVSMMSMVRQVVRQELAFEDEDAYFAKSIAQMLRRMDRSKRNKTKVRLLQLLSEIDEEVPD